jgi:hypothetical protein
LPLAIIDYFHDIIDIFADIDAATLPFIIAITLRH